MTHLSAATVDVTSTEIRLSYSLTETPVEGHWTASTTFIGGAQGPIDQVGFKFVDDEPPRVFVFDHDANRQHYLDAEPVESSGVWSVTVPRRSVRAAGGEWRASLDVNGRASGTIEGTC